MYKRPNLLSEGKRNFLEDHPFELVTYPLPKNIVVEEVMIPMRDGIKLAATVFRPDTTTPVPVITTATPYGKNRYDQWNAFRDPPEGTVPGDGGFYLGRIEFSDHAAFESPDPGFWVPQGYAVMLVDLPGRGRSESNPTATPGPEARWRDTMAWLEAQSWCTGKVGMSGVSALCATQWIAAQEAPPQLQAIIAWEGINETGPGGGYGGIPETAFVEWMESYWLQPNYNPQAAGPEPYIKDWHFDMAAIKVPALICASFSDQELHTWDTFEAFRRIKSPHKWLYNHRRQKWGAYYGKNELALQKRFLDRFLKDDMHAMDDVPTVRLEINRNRFDHKIVHAKQWPIEDTRYDSLFLDAAQGKLVMALPATQSSMMFSPAPIIDAKNRAVFDYTFNEDTDIIGHMALKLFVEGIETEDLDLFIGIEKLDHAGNEVYFFSASGGNANGPVSRGWLRVSRRELNVERSTPWRPVLSFKNKQPLTAHEIVEVNIAIMPCGTTFLAGETLRLVVQSWSVNGQWEGGECRQWASQQTGQGRLYTGGQFPSCLLVPKVQ